VKLKPNTKYLFLHIPKTGGTTLRNIIYNSFDDSIIYPNRAELRANKGKYLTHQEILLNTDILKDKKIIFGHYGFNYQKLFDENVITICFFRNPISRTLSHLNHLRIKGELTDTDVYKLQHIKPISNIQSRYMGYVTGKDNFNTAKINISKVNIIGLTDEYDKSLKIINKILDWNLEAISPLNDNSEDYFKFSDQLISKISKTNYQDFILYHLASKIFDQQVISILNNSSNVSI